MVTVRNAILAGGVDTPIGNILNVQNNAQWLTYLVYSVPHVALNLPPLATVHTSSIDSMSTDDVTILVNALSDDKASLEQMSQKGTAEAFYLAVKSMDKLAIAAYTLYLYGSTE